MDRSPYPAPEEPTHPTLDRVLPDVYQELRVIAHRQLARHAADRTVSTTGLVHEAYLKLANQERVHWNDRAHFLALAALAMRHVLVDRAKARLAEKRGGVHQQVTFDERTIPAEAQAEALLDLSDAIDRLATVEPRLAEVIDCRFFGGLSEEEIASALGVTTRTVQRDWAKARMLLRRALAT
ncbi:MAG: ECF-type sigma factor [Gemmatimonadota bacterium]